MTAVRPPLRLPGHNFSTILKKYLNLLVNKGTQRKKSPDLGFLFSLIIGKLPSERERDPKFPVIAARLLPSNRRTAFVVGKWFA